MTFSFLMKIEAQIFNTRDYLDQYDCKTIIYCKTPSKYIFPRLFLRYLLDTPPMSCNLRGLGINGLQATKSFQFSIFFSHGMTFKSVILDYNPSTSKFNFTNLHANRDKHASYLNFIMLLDAMTINMHEHRTTTHSCTENTGPEKRAHLPKENAQRFFDYYR